MNGKESVEVDRKHRLVREKAERKGASNSKNHGGCVSKVLGSYRHGEGTQHNLELHQLPARWLLEEKETPSPTQHTYVLLKNNKRNSFIVASVTLGKTSFLVLNNADF